jgi:hypothetical protein
MISARQIGVIPPGSPGAPAMAGVDAAVEVLVDAAVDVAVAAAVGAAGDVVVGAPSEMYSQTPHASDAAKASAALTAYARAAQGQWRAVALPIGRVMWRGYYKGLS